MATHPPNPAERLIFLMEERRPALGADPLRLLFWDLLMCLVRLLGSIAEQRAQQQACRDEAGAEPLPIGAPAGFEVVAADAGADRRGAAGGSVPQGRVAVNAAVGAARDTPVIDGATQDLRITDTGAVRAASEPPHLAAIARAVAVSRTGVGFWRLRSKKSGRGDAQNYADFVTL